MSAAKWHQEPDILHCAKGHRYTAWSCMVDGEPRYQVTRNYPPQPPGAPGGLGGYALLAAVMALRGLSRPPLA